MARHEITLKRIVYDTPQMTHVAVRRDLEYAASDDGPLTLDLYLPATVEPDPGPDRALAAVIIVGGFADVGVPLTLGCTSKEMEMTISWGQLLAASGMIAIAYTKRDPALDLVRLIQYVRAHARALAVDPDRIALFAASGNAPTALSLLMRGAPVRVACAVLECGFTLDAPGATGVAEAAGTWKFANPTAGKSVDDLRDDVPLLVVRAGGDQFPHLNEALDRFVGGCLARDLPLTVINHAKAPHAFDLFDPSDGSRGVVRDILWWVQRRTGTIPTP